MAVLCLSAPSLRRSRVVTAEASRRRDYPLGSVFVAAPPPRGDSATGEHLFKLPHQVVVLVVLKRPGSPAQRSAAGFTLLAGAEPIASLVVAVTVRREVIDHAVREPVRDLHLPDQLLRRRASERVRTGAT